MSSETKFEGWVGLGSESAEGKMVWQGYTPKPFEEMDVDIEVGTSIFVFDLPLTIVRSHIAASAAPIGTP